MEFIGDVFTTFEALFVLAYSFDEEFMYPLVGTDEFVAGILNQGLFESEMGDGVIYRIVDHLLDHHSVQSDLGVVQFVDVIDDLSVLSVYDINACIQVFSPYQVCHSDPLNII